jgi:curved DNA-binding protein CbpA
MGTSYDVLGIAKDADADTIKNAYRQRAKACHPAIWSSLLRSD